MTQEQGNAIDQAQANLDAQQEGVAPAAQAKIYATTEDIDRIVSNAVRGNQSLIDRGLTALRKDFNTQLEQERERMRADAALDGLPEEVKGYMTPIIAKVRSLEDQINKTASPTEPAPAGDTDLSTFLEGMGLSQSTPGLDLAAYGRGDMPTFLASTASAIRGVHSEAPQTPAALPTLTESPPVDGTPAGGSGSGTIWDAYDLFNSGKITQEEFTQRTASADPAELNR